MGPIISQVEEAARLELEAGFARWRSSLSGSTKKQTAWIKRRASLRTGLANPRWSEAEELRRTAIHPVEVIRRAEGEWCPRWTAGAAEESPVRELLSELVPPPPGDARATPTFSSTRLLIEGCIQNAWQSLRTRWVGGSSFPLAAGNVLAGPWGSLAMCL